MMPFWVLIVLALILIPTYIAIVAVSFIFSIIIPVLVGVPFFVLFTFLEIIFGVLCITLCIASLVKSISVIKNNRRNSDYYKKSKNVLPIVLIVFVGIFITELPVFMILNIVDLIFAIV